MSAPVSTGSNNSLPIGTRLSDFEITGVLGEGGFGIVYLAFDHALQRTVAIKEYMPGALAGRAPNHNVSMRAERDRATFNVGLKSFINEARFLAQFDHPALVKVYRFWEQNQTAYTAMQYYDGRTVKDIVTRNPALVNQTWCMRLAGQVLDALGMLATMQLVHRDVSPDNIIIQANGDAVLLDFGSARQILGDMTHGMTVILKPGYAPVEQYAGDATLAQGPYTDIYALSAVLYFAITGVAPPTSIARMIKDPIVPLASRDLPGYTTDFLAAIDAGMAVLVEQRPQTTDAMRALLGIDTVSAPRVRPAGSTERFATVAHAETPAPLVMEQDDQDKAVLAPAMSMTAATASATPTTSASASAAAEQTAAPVAPMLAKVPSGAPKAPPASAPVTGKRARATAIAGGVLVVAFVVMYALFGRPADTVMVAPSQTPSTAQTPANGAQATTGSSAQATSAAGVAMPSEASTANPPAPAMITDDVQNAARAAGAAPVAASVSTVAGVPAAPVKPVDPVPETASYKLAIKPWGTIYVDGKERGVSPPLKRLVLSPGHHTIRIVNPGFPEHQTEVTLGANKSGTIEYDFPAAQDH